MHSGGYVIEFQNYIATVSPNHPIYRRENMSYIRAEDVLPPDVLALVQTYIDGKMLYIPKKQSDRNNWGSVSGIKEYYAERNAGICAEAQSGVRICELADRYGLTPKSIQRILRNNRPSCCTKHSREGKI